MQLPADASEYRLHILPGRCPPGFQQTDFHNKVYAFWKGFWGEVFAENGVTSIPDANVFYRQDLVAVVTKAEQIVGTLFYTENNLASDVTCEIGYFARPYISRLCGELRERKLTKVATYEMLAVSSAFRKRETGLSFGTVLLGIIVNAFRSLDAEVLIGPVRLDNGVHRMVQEFGWQLVSGEYSLHGTPVAISALYRAQIRDCPSGPHQALIKRLWSGRIDHREGTATGTPDADADASQHTSPALAAA